MNTNNWIPRPTSKNKKRTRQDPLDNFSRTKQVLAAAHSKTTWTAQQECDKARQAKLLESFVTEPKTLLFPVEMR
jgi:hypothetical protein